VKVVIMQPTFLPWVGYFDLIDQADVFVFLDQVQFSKQSWQQRNRLRTPTGLEWITVPVMSKGKPGQSISEVEIDCRGFPEKQIRQVGFAYAKARHFERYFENLTEIMRDAARSQLLCSVSCELIRWLSREFGIDSKFVYSSELNVRGKRSELLVNILDTLGAQSYLSPAGSLEYLREDWSTFENAGVHVCFQNYEHPSYRQVYEPFIPSATALDLLLNEGSASMDIIRSGRGSSIPAEDLI
jgi:hypothetical protein